MITRVVMVLVLAMLPAASARAQLGPEIAQRHAERAGKKRETLKAFTAEGRTFVGEEMIPFKLWAARPDLLRVESQTPGRKVTQCFDGKHEPWISHSDVKDGRPLRMSAESARDFRENADFDGALVDYEKKGYSVDYAGEEEIGGRPAYKLLVMNERDDVYFYWLDVKTYDVVKRTVFQVANGKRVSVETFFREFKQVGGVRQPHRIETRSDGKVLYVMLIDKVEANPKKMSFEIFAAPEGWPGLVKPADMIAEALEKS